MLSPARSEATIRAYFPHSMAATSTVLAIPLAIVWITQQAGYFSIPAPITALLALGFMTVGFAIGSKLWNGTPGSEDISFGELMLWSWYRLAQADDRITEFRTKSARVEASPEEQLEVLQELSDALERKDPYTRGHSARVERHAVRTAAAMGLSLKEIDVLRKAASMHDVGKVRIPNRVLHKNGSLDAEERALIEEHPVLGAWIVSTLGDEQIVVTVRHHHERWDGAGYPDGISGSDIPLFSRIIAVADTFDAITSTRSYRAGSSRARAIEVLKAECGKQFDRDVVEAFLSTLPERSSALAALITLGAEPLWKKLAQWFREFGSGAVAPGLGAVGAAIVLGSGTFLPAPAPSEGARPQGSGAVTEIDTGASSDAASALARAHAAAPRVLGTHVERKRPDVAQRRAKERGKRSVAARNKAKTSEPELATAAAKPSGGGSKPSAQEATAPALKADPMGPVDDVLEEIQDPKKAHGEDCAGLGSASRGSELHCN